jgi:hypothetical protein
LAPLIVADGFDGEFSDALGGECNELDKARQSATLCSMSFWRALGPEAKPA